MDAKIWEQWGDKHEHADQKKRLESAKKANMTPISINHDEGTGEFSGSTNYITTLTDCTCIDFKRRGLPCKHMYRLAIELGILNEQASTDKTKIRTPKAQRMKLDTIVEVVESLTDNQRILLRELLKDILYVSNGSVATQKTSDCDELIGHGFFVSDDDNYNVMLGSQKRYQLIDRLDSAGISGFKRNCKATALVEWIKENVADMEPLFNDLYVLNINTKLEGIQRKLYSYLLRRDTDDFYYDMNSGTEITVPYGAGFVEIISIDGSIESHLEFPNDEITLLLDKYGKNRLSK